MDLLKDTPPQDPRVAAERFRRGSLRLMALLRGEPPGGTEASLPDPEGPFYGYRLEPGVDGPSSKWVVNLVARVAGMQLAGQRGIEPGSKRECLALYLSELGGELAPLVRATQDLLLREWEYRAPSAGPDHRRFRQILAEIPRLEAVLLATAPFQDE